MNEFDLIRTYFARQMPSSAAVESSEACVSGIALGIGDDAALVDIRSGKQLTISVDTLVAGVHFPENARGQDIAQRALAVALSDLAAMGAQPRWFTLSLTLPEADEAWLADFSEGLFCSAEQYGCCLIGGDTTRGPLAISLQVMGEVSEGQAFLRSGAKVGDAIYVTGCLGDGAAGLAFIEERLPSDVHADYLFDAYYRPVARFRESQVLQKHINSAIDISDGLLADLTHICEASGVGAELDLHALPYSHAVESVAVSQRESWALSGGDDYELCFTVGRKEKKFVEDLIARKQLIASEIGFITHDSTITCKKEGLIVKPEKYGYMHFGRK